MSVLIIFIKLIAVFDLLVIAVYFGGDIFSTMLNKLRRKPKQDDPFDFSLDTVTVLGVRRRTGTDPSKDAAIRDREFERLSAENGAGWLCGQAGTARAEGVGLPDAPKQQQLEPADPQSA